MSADTVKKEIIALAKKIRNNTITEEELVTFFNSHRVVFMSSPTITQRDYHDLQNDNFNPYLNPAGKMMISCSCGSRKDSCAEDGPGFYSQFYINPEGEILRVKIQKEIF